MNQELRDKIADRRIIASVSGGKDSSALSAWLTEHGIEHDRVFIDTHNEHDAIYHAVMRREQAHAAAREASDRLCLPIGREPRADDEIALSLDALDAQYGEAPLVRALGSFIVLSAAVSFAETVIAHGMFPSRQIQFCTDDLKAATIAAWFDTLDCDYVNAVGIRASESANRAELSDWEWSERFDCYVWRPIIGWTERDVTTYLRRRNVPLNHLYATGMNRVGCWPCKNLHGQQLLHFASVATARHLDDLRALESFIGTRAGERYGRRRGIYEAGGAEALTARDRNALLDGDGEPKPFRLPVLFQPANAPRADMTLDEVIAYFQSRPMAKKRARQPEMFDAGCMRWGLCETAPDGDE